MKREDKISPLQFSSVYIDLAIVKIPHLRTVLLCSKLARRGEEKRVSRSWYNRGIHGEHRETANGTQRTKVHGRDLASGSALVHGACTHTRLPIEWNINLSLWQGLSLTRFLEGVVCSRIRRKSGMLDGRFLGDSQPAGRFDGRTDKTLATA